MPNDDISRVIENNRNDLLNMLFNGENSINNDKYRYNNNLFTSEKERESTLDTRAIEINSSDKFVINQDPLSPSR